MRKAVQGPINADKVLRALVDFGRPMSAYEVLEAVRSDGIRSPLTVYRALALLIESKKARRVESISAYIPCSLKNGGGSIVLIICDDCGSVAELPELGALTSLDREIDHVGFRVDSVAIEIKGRCGACHEEPPR